MAKSDINLYDQVAGSNTDCNGINVNTGWSPANVGPAFRELMAALGRVNQALVTVTEAPSGIVWSSIKTSGPVTIGGTMTAAAGQVSGTLGVVGATSLSTGGAGGNTIGYSSGANGLTITQTGAAAGQALNINVNNVASGNAHEAFYFQGTQCGSITTTTGTTTNYNTTSDYRLKDITGPSDGSLIDQLKVYQGTWKRFPDHPAQAMMLAHEVQQWFPYAVTGEKDEMEGHSSVMKPQMLDHSKLVPELIAKVQQLNSRVMELEREVVRLRRQSI